uniref:Uncharacterized protein n=1 Tax=Mycena chlorophos TaxID=658473 RepID=A0ABQ0LPT4_MYCCL|nr:predicted protein [Mycena chlorophos]
MAYTNGRPLHGDEPGLHKLTSVSFCGVSRGRRAGYRNDWGPGEDIPHWAFSHAAGCTRARLSHRRWHLRLAGAVAYSRGWCPECSSSVHFRLRIRRIALETLTRGFLLHPSPHKRFSSSSPRSSSHSKKCEIARPSLHDNPTRSCCIALSLLKKRTASDVTSPLPETRQQDCPREIASFCPSAPLSIFACWCWRMQLRAAAGLVDALPLKTARYCVRNARRFAHPSQPRRRAVPFIVLLPEQRKTASPSRTIPYTSFRPPFCLKANPFARTCPMRRYGPRALVRPVPPRWGTLALEFPTTEALCDVHPARLHRAGARLRICISRPSRRVTAYVRQRTAAG